MEENNYKKLIEDSKKYLGLRYDLLRLELLEKLTKIIALIVMIIVFAVLVMGALVYFSFAFVAWMRPFFGSAVVPLCIIGGIFVVLMGLIYAFRSQLLINPLISHLSEILFHESSKKDLYEE